MAPGSHLTTSQVARLLRISRQAVVQRVQRGDLTPVEKLAGQNGAYLFDRSTIERLAMTGER